ncbi:MAG: M20/M25/M40 family metallo-hydrolase, partial [Treponema sp.]|nr:M20/M25/M40 family metallo-hydrolase [Treponema sp.]
REHLDIFGKDDRILIPDGGDSNGETIEIAEKNIFWLRFRTVGKQAHGSRPDQGRNAALAACELALKVNAMEQVFDKENPLFDPPRSTFQPTMREANVSSVNIIPGEDVMYADCRINPCYSLDEVRKEISKRVRDVEEKYSVKIEVSEVQAESSRPTPQDAPIVKDLADALKAVHGIEARCVGIGGGTVGAYLRNAGLDCVVWSSLDETAHQPNEYAIISNIIKDAETIAYMASRP